MSPLSPRGRGVGGEGEVSPLTPEGRGAFAPALARGGPGPIILPWDAAPRRHRQRGTSMRRLTASGLSALLLTLGAVRAADWPQFRGPNCSGRAADGVALPAALGPDVNVLWKVELPPGHSSPVVVGDRVYLTAVRDGKLWTIALDRGSGKTLWEAEAPHRGLEKVHQIGSHAQSSPAADGDGVVPFFGSCGWVRSRTPSAPAARPCWSATACCCARTTTRVRSWRPTSGAPASWSGRPTAPSSCVATARRWSGRPTAGNRWWWPARCASPATTWRPARKCGRFTASPAPSARRR